MMSQYSGPLHQPGYGQFGNTGGYFQSSGPFPAGSVMPGAGFSSAGFSSSPMISPYGSGFSGPMMHGGGFVNPQVPFSYGQQPQFAGPSHFGSGIYDRPRSRHSSRHRSKSRSRRGSRSSSRSDNERRHRGSPFAGPGMPYMNTEPYMNMEPYSNAPPLSPRAGSPVIPPRRSGW
ncbi:unnamed protein product [Rotaria sordida]|uniref:Uncharacterized protein n=1 Tax=Rotaria sordida TaxID=392033 RepID=A0A814FAE4_9BILA|nr:unnamed protein product [Rotaria sordida]CAF3775557.1 unnamed protein product [Rotaria sordida]